MDVKTFEAVSMKDAIKKVKKEFGADAVILSTKKSQGGSGVVVTASAPASKRSWGAELAPTSDSTMRVINERLDAANLRVSNIAELMMTKTNGQSIEAGIHDLKVLLLENLRNKEGSAIADLPKYLVPIERQLRLTGFDDTYIAQLMKDLGNHECPECRGEDDMARLSDHFRNLAVKWVFDRIKISASDHLMPGQTAIQVFVGAPGVGKTTAIAKLAARYHHREKKNVLLISLDTQRLAAAEQMRVFAKILDVPFMVIDTAEALENALLAHRDVDLAFVDTPGCTFKDQVQMQQILKLQNLALPLDVTVVLSATEKESQSEKAIRSFAALGIHNLLFTKLDESWSFGEIFNLSYRWSIPLGFFSIGHQIPEHIEKASRERIIERIFDI